VRGEIAEIGATGYDRSTTRGTNDGFVGRFWIGGGEGYQDWDACGITGS